MSIHIAGLNKCFRKGIGSKRIPAVVDLSLEINSGEVFGFVGPNGAGKSTTIKTLLNLVFPDSGEVKIFDRPVSDFNVRRDIGYLPENPCYYSSLTAEELLFFGAEVSGVPKSLIYERIEDVLRRVQLLDSAKRQLKTYSKGMVQRAGIALALIHDPKLVILDEPMSGLDPLGRKLVGDLILEMKEQGKTVFFSSHILNDAERFCDSIGILVRGRLRRTDKLSVLLNEFSSLERAFLSTVEQVEKGGL